MSALKILLIACYELGHPPLTLAWPLAFLRQAGFTAQTLDLSLTAFSDELAADAALVAIAAPMHTALRLGVEAARRTRAVNPRAHVCFFGLYAQLNADLLFRAGLADSLSAGEAAPVLVRLAQGLQTGQALETIPGLTLAGATDPGGHFQPAAPWLERLDFPVPERAALPPLTRYARYQHGAELQLAGYTEASRGCLHTCQHCPLTPIYGGRFFVVPAEVVLADIAQQVAAGARHITFGDPDFLNGPRHALNLARALHARWPALTFDFTTKVEHILQHRALFPELAQSGATFVVSAVESVSDQVLRRLHKGHTAADIDTALAILDAAGLALQPTLVAFTPWTTLDDYLAQLEFIHTRGLHAHIPPVQLSIRLLIPPGSPLAHAPDAAAWLGALEAENFTYRWTHPDPRMDALYTQVAAIVAEAAAVGKDDRLTFTALRAAAYAAAGRPVPDSRSGSPAESAHPRPAPPRLTENWFC